MLRRSLGCALRNWANSPCGRTTACMNAGAPSPRICITRSVTVRTWSATCLKEPLSSRSSNRTMCVPLRRRVRAMR